MDRCAVFVDAGYLFAGGSKTVTGSPMRRIDLSLDVGATASFFLSRAQELSGLPVLRIYWYDGARSSNMTTDH